MSIPHFEALCVAVARLRDLDLSAARRECEAKADGLRRLGWPEPSDSDVQAILILEDALAAIDRLAMRDRRSTKSLTLTRPAGQGAENPEPMSVAVSDHGDCSSHAPGGASTGEQLRPRAITDRPSRLPVANRDSGTHPPSGSEPTHD
jgi:hypothetical protein